MINRPPRSLSSWRSSHLLSEGITTAHDAGALQVDLAAQWAMADRGDLLLRLYSMVLASDEAALSRMAGAWAR